jgi:hypothetical protein
LAKRPLTVHIAGDVLVAALAIGIMLGSDALLDGITSGHAACTVLYLSVVLARAALVIAFLESLFTVASRRLWAGATKITTLRRLASWLLPAAVITVVAGLFVFLIALIMVQGA